MKYTWQIISDYYTTIGKTYHVDPFIFLGIHFIATPLFIFSVAWLLKNIKQHKAVFWPVFTAIIVFNAANIYLVVAGKNIPWYIFLILAGSSIVSGYASFLKIRRKVKAAKGND